MPRITRDRRAGAGTLPRRRHLAAREGLRVLGQGAPGADAALGRALPDAPAGGRGAARGDAARPRDRRRGPAARHRRGHVRDRRRHPRAVRRRDRRPGRGPHEALEDRVPEPRGSPGRELPQDAARDVEGHPHHPDQARRPPAQHPHARVHEGRLAAAHRAGDARDLRAARAPPRHLLDEGGARGPRVPRAASGAVRADRGEGRRHQGGARPLHRRREDAALDGAREARACAARSRAG